MKFASEGKIENGAFKEEDPGFLRKVTASFEGKRVRFTLENIRDRRSTQQNKYYWAVVVRMVGEAMGERDQETVHHILKTMFNYRIFVGKGDAEVRIPVTSTELDTKEFSDYIEDIRRWGAEFLGINIPDPVRAGY